VHWRFVGLKQALRPIIEGFATARLPAMPIYAYKCESCGHSQDILRKISDVPLTDCPACGASTFTKQVTAAGFQLKGSGWYVTDFRDNGSGASKSAAPATDAGKTPAASSGDSKPAQAASTDSKAADSKPASTPAATPAPASGSST